MPNCQTVVGPHISHGLNTKTNSCRAEEQTGSCQCGSYQTNKLCGASLGKSTTQICIKLKKKNFLHPSFSTFSFTQGTLSMMRRTFFLKLIPVQYGDGGRFPYRGGPLPTLVMGRTSVELFRFSHRNCKKNKSEWAHEFFRQEGETSLLKSSDHSPLVHIVHLLCGCVWSPPTGQSGVLWLLQGTL